MEKYGTARTAEGNARLAAILELPLREEPETDEERAIFDQAEADLYVGRRGHTSDEILAAVEAMRDDAAE